MALYQPTMSLGLIYARKSYDAVFYLDFYRLAAFPAPQLYFTVVYR
nr:MAG TPA: hypothetical protein [Bacteriophage sp.]